MAHGHSAWKRLGDGSLIAEEADEGLGHIVPLKSYTNVFLALLALTIVTVGAATMDFGSFNLVIALAIASLKAFLVLSIFMHMWFEGKLLWGVVVYCIVLVSILFLGTVGDIVEKEKPRPAIKITETPKAESAHH